jgi:hypothetical protein
LTDPLSREISASGVWTAIHKTGWWEEVLVFYAAIKRDISYLLNDLAFFTEQHDADGRRRRLVERWLEVADLTDYSTVNAAGTEIVAQARVCEIYRRNGAGYASERHQRNVLQNDCERSEGGYSAVRSLVDPLGQKH